MHYNKQTNQNKQKLKQTLQSLSDTDLPVTGPLLRLDLARSHIRKLEAECEGLREELSTMRRDHRGSVVFFSPPLFFGLILV
jgi:hypothetical protein